MPHLFLSEVKDLSPKRGGGYVDQRTRVYKKSGILRNLTRTRSRAAFRQRSWARQRIDYPPTGTEIIGELGTTASLPTRRRSAHRALERGCQGAPYFSFVKTPAECRCGRSRRAGNPRLLNENGRPFAATSIRSKIEWEACDGTATTRMYDHPPLPFRVEKTRRGWSGAVIVRLRAYPFLNFLGFKIRPCEEGPAAIAEADLLVTKLRGVGPAVNWREQKHSSPPI